MHLDYEIAIETQRDFISNKERSNLQEMFDLIDSNKDGLIDFYEVFLYKKNEKRNKWKKFVDESIFGK